MPKYSLLTSDPALIQDKSSIEMLLFRGVKVIAFGQANELDQLARGFERFRDVRLLQTYPITGQFPSITIKDGIFGAHEHLFEVLTTKAPAFNYEQYLVEHADAYNNVIVEAGAGTGKTTVMIDRILFLLHTVPELRLEDIGIITFTNEATQNMKHKLQAALTKRYYATRAPRYLHLLEDSAKIQVQTIHSFSKDIINELGSSIGYAKSLGLRSFKFEKRQLIHDVLNQKYMNSPKTLSKGFGAQLYELDRLILDFWAQLENIGLTDEEIASLDWGNANSNDSKALHQTLSAVFPELNDRYNALKMEEDSIADPTQHVTVLTRTNFQLSRIGEWCAGANIPCYIKKEGTFFTSRAVKDFFCLVKAFIFPNEATHLFDYLESAYANVDFAIKDICHFEPGSSEQVEYIRSLVDEEVFAWYQREFRLKPVISVLHEMVDSSVPAERYVALRRQELTADGEWEPNALEKQLAIEATQYDANIDKLFQILRKHFSGQMASLYQIYSFLKIQIATNITEDEPDVSGEMGCGCVYGMTVHKAKGLEFDTVLLPFTHRAFRKEVATELLLDETKKPPRVGWSKVAMIPGSMTDIADHQCNDYYEECVKKEFVDVDREEARLLYVALTRAIRRVECFVIGSETHSWAHMLEG